MEWTVVTVIIAIVGLGIAIVKPVVSLTQSITKLTVLVDKLAEDMGEYVGKNRDSHARIWEKNKEQDDRLNDHDKRISVMEHK